jgi:hypothetical protein
LNYFSYISFLNLIIITAAGNAQEISYNQDILQNTLDELTNEHVQNTDTYKNAQTYYDASSHLYSGYVGASIFYFFAMIFSLISSLIISPIICGSPQESKTIKKPIEINYNDSTVNI